MTKSSNNKIACIFEDISFRTHVNYTISSCSDQSKYVTLFLGTVYEHGSSPLETNQEPRDQ